MNYVYNGLQIVFAYKRDILKRYSIGRTLEKAGAVVRIVTRKSNYEYVPALRKMFFNCIGFRRENGDTYTFSGRDQGFTHREFLNLFTFAKENPSEFDQMLSYGATGRDTYEWTQNAIKNCFFTGEETRLYRLGGENTYYQRDGGLHTAENLVISRHITRRMRRCANCNKYVIQHFESMTDGMYCHNCIHILKECISCGHRCHGKKCNSCSDFYSQINDYGDKPVKWWFFDKVKGKLLKDDVEKCGHGKRVKALYIGDEHEVECIDNDDRHYHAERVSNSYNDELFYTTSDGSLGCGFEMHTHPATHKTHSSRKWDGIAFLRENGGRSFDTNTAGLHFHLNRSAFSNWHLLKFIKFLMDNIAVTLAIGRRKNISNLNDYARFEFGFFNTLKRNIVRDIKRYKRNGDTYPTNPVITNSSRGAINLQNRKTIELRFMGGSLEEMKYKAKIDHIQAVYEYTNISGLKGQNVTAFCEYVRKNKNRFRHLLQEMNTAEFKRAVQYPAEIPENLNY